MKIANISKQRLALINNRMSPFEQIDDEGRVTRFVEKPVFVRSSDTELVYRWTPPEGTVLPDGYEFEEGRIEYPVPNFQYAGQAGD